MIRARFLKQLAAVAALVVVSTTAFAGVAHANETTPTVSASTADRVPPPPPGAVPANAGGTKVVPGDGYSVQAAWWCEPGYPCLYDYDNGLGYPFVLDGCGWWNLGEWLIGDGAGGSRLANDWANSARTQGNSITVYNWTGTYWDNWGTVPSYQYWNFQLKNQIDAVNVNCASTPPPF
ncbi:hypothetical protein AB0L34_12250 [Micromonospora sp. NPDC052213]|uniref:hypothetical protein n=1 Tax=Micromonospora sp. NPDC052213 TaxID=3155812 RepID=UPI00342B754D